MLQLFVSYVLKEVHILSGIVIMLLFCLLLKLSFKVHKGKCKTAIYFALFQIPIFLTNVFYFLLISATCTLTCTKTFFPSISKFCTSLGVYNIDGSCFVVRCQNLPKYQRNKSNILRPKTCGNCAQLQHNFFEFLRNFCYKFSATFGFFESNFLGGLYNTFFHTFVSCEIGSVKF